MKTFTLLRKNKFETDHKSLERYRNLSSYDNTDKNQIFHSKLLSNKKIKIRKECPKQKNFISHHTHISVEGDLDFLHQTAHNVDISHNNLRKKSFHIKAFSDFSKHSTKTSKKIYFTFDNLKKELSLNQHQYKTRNIKPPSSPFCYMSKTYTGSNDKGRSIHQRTKTLLGQYTAIDKGPQTYRNKQYLSPFIKCNPRPYSYLRENTSAPKQQNIKLINFEKTQNLHFSDLSHIKNQRESNSRTPLIKVNRNNVYHDRTLNIRTVSPFFHQYTERTVNDSFNAELQEKIIKCYYELSHVGYNGRTNKKNNQDSHYIYNNFAGNPRTTIFVVCDGHGEEGNKISHFISRAIPFSLSEKLSNYDIVNEKQEIIHKIITDTFDNISTSLLNTKTINAVCSGTTSVNVIVTPTKLIIANVGDSRAIIGKYKEGKWGYEQLSRDHKPNEKDEQARILKMGGRIHPFYQKGIPIGPRRVWVKDQDKPGLAMSRSFGDQLAKTVGVVSTPEIKDYILRKEDKFILIASDGLWEYLSNQDCVDIVKQFYKNYDVKGCAESLYRNSKKKWLEEEGVIDDITVIVVFFE